MKRNILIVEHDEKTAALYESWLRELGFGVIRAGNGVEALQILSASLVQGLILDLDVPVLNGLTLLTQLRQRFAEVPVMVVADVESTDTLLEALENGAQDYLTKPAAHALFSQKCRRTFAKLPESPLMASGSKNQIRSATPRVLIVDDEDDLRMLLRSLLESQGYVCEEAQTGQEGLEKIFTGAFSLVLLDYHMPLLNGLEMLQAAVTAGSGSIPPVIMMTAHVSTSVQRDAIQLGVVQILSKPFELDEMLLAIGRALKNSQSPSPCSQGPQ